MNINIANTTTHTVTDPINIVNHKCSICGKWFKTEMLFSNKCNNCKNAKI